MSYINRTMIVAAAYAAMARSLSAGLAGDAGAGMYAVPLSSDGAGPASHYISAGMVEDTFAALMPLTTISHAEDGTPSESTQPGQPETIIALAAQAGITLALADVQALLNACDVTDTEPFTRLAMLGLQIIEPQDA